MSGKVAIIQLYAREEQDGSFTLVIDTPADEGNVPVDLGAGYESIAAVQQAVIDSLTAPAVAEDRIAAIEEYIPKLIELIDVANEHGDAIGGVDDRVARMEAELTALRATVQQLMPEEARMQPARPVVGRRIAQPGQLRRAPVQEFADPPARMVQPKYAPPTAQRATPPPARPAGPASTLDRPPDTVTRETHPPHIPFGRVSRGPGSE